MKRFRYKPTIIIIGGVIFLLFYTNLCVKYGSRVKDKCISEYLSICYPEAPIILEFNKKYHEMGLAIIDTSFHFKEVERISRYKYKYKWVGLIPSKNGKLYGIPNDITCVLEIDPRTGKTSTFGRLSESKHKYTGGVLAPDGMIYGLPRSAGTLLKIDPYKRTAEEISLNLPYMRDRFYSGVLYEDRIYMMPRNSHYIMVININDYSTYMISTPRFLSYAGCVVHPNGLIYCVPWGGKGKIMVVNPRTDDISFIGKYDKYDGFNLIVDPISLNIYGFLNYSGVLKIDTKTNMVEKLHEEITPHAFYGSEMGINGRIYSTLGHGTILYEFNPADESIKAVAIESDGIDNAKCAGGCTDMFGNVYMVPAHGLYLYRLKFDKTVSNDSVSLEFITSPHLGNY